ncbi:uncharacterized protein [Primulina eburnea]|uniref:uncharacterized protein isoform X1 n=1 Tax=Primulina eburnea TaxID=1245227 RepID=UPI003C6CA4B6
MESVDGNRQVLWTGGWTLDWWPVDVFDCYCCYWPRQLYRACCFRTGDIVWILYLLRFAGATNADIISAANTYVQIRTKTKLRKKNKNIFGDDDETNSIQDQSCYSVF